MWPLGGHRFRQACHNICATLPGIWPALEQPTGGHRERLPDATPAVPARTRRRPVRRLLRRSWRPPGPGPPPVPWPPRHHHLPGDPGRPGRPVRDRRPGRRAVRGQRVRHPDPEAGIQQQAPGQHRGLPVPDPGSRQAVQRRADHRQQRAGRAGHGGQHPRHAGQYQAHLRVDQRHRGQHQRHGTDHVRQPVQSVTRVDRQVSPGSATTRRSSRSPWAAWFPPARWPG